jgi:hypothetical protein
MKAPDAMDTVRSSAQLDGYLAACRILVERHSGFATAAELLRLTAPDAPGFLLDALYRPGTREALIELSAKLTELGTADTPDPTTLPSITAETNWARDPSDPMKKLWWRLHSQPQYQWEAERRVRVLMAVQKLIDCGRTLAEAIALVEISADEYGSDIIAWWNAVRGVPSRDWLPIVAFIGVDEPAAA